MKAGPTNHKKQPFLPLNAQIDYELLDCGNQRKLERFGKYILNRPEVSAKQKPSLSIPRWKQADWVFEEEAGKKGKWSSSNQLPSEWTIAYRYKGLKFQFGLHLTAFKHVGIFPEQAENWQYIQNALSKIKGEKKVLNLFAYTGAASIVAAKCGALVTNVDSVKQVLNWGRENAALNGVDNIRWILEDAKKFVAKSVRRGDTYHGIIMDPPAFGYGAKGEKWKLETDLAPLLNEAIKLLEPDQHFFVLNTYSPRLPLDDLVTILRENPRFPKRFEATILGLGSVNNSRLSLGNLIRMTN